MTANMSQIFRFTTVSLLCFLSLWLPGSANSDIVDPLILHLQKQYPDMHIVVLPKSTQISHTLEFSWKHQSHYNNAHYDQPVPAIMTQFNLVYPSPPHNMPSSLRMEQYFAREFEDWYEGGCPHQMRSAPGLTQFQFHHQKLGTISMCAHPLPQPQKGNSKAQPIPYYEMEGSMPLTIPSIRGMRSYLILKAESISREKFEIFFKHLAILKAR